MTSDAPSILRLQHVSLPFPGDEASLAEARRFYGEILGLSEQARPSTLPGTGLWYGTGDQELHLFSEPSGVAVNESSKRHPCFETGDVGRLRQHLDAADVRTRGDDGEIRGRPRFFALDPFGNTLEFVQFLPDHW